MSETLLLLNPAKRKGKRKHKRKKSRRRYGFSARGFVGQTQGMLRPAVAGAVGALAVNGIINYAPLPDALKAGRTIYITKGVLSVLLGMLGRNLPGLGQYAHDMARGALTVTLADLGKDLALSYAGMNLSGTGYLNPGYIVSPKTPYNAGALPNVPQKLGYYMQPRVGPRPVVAGLSRAGQYVGWGRR
jgi:hypothetical protein